MKNQHNANIHISNFWFGFLFGGASALTLMYLFGSKQGRETLKKLLKFSENLEENIGKTIDRIDKKNPKSTKRESGLSIETVGNILQKIKDTANKS